MKQILSPILTFAICQIELQFTFEILFLNAELFCILGEHAYFKYLFRTFEFLDGSLNK